MVRVLTESVSVGQSSAKELQNKINGILIINHNIKVINITSIKHDTEKHNTNTVIITFELPITIDNCVSNQVVGQFENSFL